MTLPTVSFAHACDHRHRDEGAHHRCRGLRRPSPPAPPRGLRRRGHRDRSHDRRPGHPRCCSAAGPVPTLPARGRVPPGGRQRRGRVVADPAGDLPGERRGHAQRAVGGQGGRHRTCPDRWLGRRVRQGDRRRPAHLRGPALRPVSPYAASKAAADHVALQAWLGYDQHVVRCRPFNHLGPGQTEKFVAPAIAGRVAPNERNGEAVVKVGNLSPKRDFTDVRDVVRAYRLMVEHGRAGEVYNVCSGTAIAVQELAEQLSRWRPSRCARAGSRSAAPGRHPGAAGRQLTSGGRHGLGARVPLADTLRDLLDDIAVARLRLAAALTDRPPQRGPPSGRLGPPQPRQHASRQHDGPPRTHRRDWRRTRVS